jgi:hopanoid biosynthesis associated RND transporter like protein HpnN
MEVAVRVVEFCRRFALLVVAAFMLATLGMGWYAVRHIDMDTDTEKLLSSDLEWRRQERAVDEAFPQMTRLLAVVVEAATPDRADDAAAALARGLSERPDLFRLVRRPDANPFFRRNGLLFLPPAELESLSARLIEAQPLIGSLAADPTARGLFAALDLGVEGVRRGQTGFAPFATTFDALSDAAARVGAGRPAEFSWQALFTGRAPTNHELRRFVLVQPVLNFSRAVSAGAGATGSPVAGSGAEVVRAMAREAGLTPDNGVRVRVTGSIAMEDEEFSTVADGAAVSTTLSLAIVAGLLVLGLRSSRLIVPIMITLLAGLVATTAFAAAAVGTLNPISIAFAVLFIGMGVDFGIQFAVRYRDCRHRFGDPVAATRATAREIAGPLVLAAVTTAAGFLSFMPTAYVGVSQLGLIAGVSMIIAVAFNMTLLPALLTVFRPHPEPEAVGYAALARLDRALLVWRRPVLAVAALAGLAGLLAVPRLSFDFNPINLRDPTTESVSTAIDLMADRDTTPFTISVLTPSPQAAGALASRLSALPEVHRALSIASFVPDGQPARLAILDDLNMLLGPTLSPGETAPPPTRDETRAAMAGLAQVLTGPLTAGDAAGNAAARRLGAALTTVAAAGDGPFDAFVHAVADGLPGRLQGLRDALSAGPVSLDTIPADFRRDWVTLDGRARVDVTPAADARHNDELVRFVTAVRAVAPQATGAAVTIQESAGAIIGAFQQAGLLALVTIIALLGATLRRARDVALVLIPLALAGLLTIAALVAGGVAFNFANIIALPLLLGVGVAYNIYYVVNWRAGESHPLESSMTRAVLFSALTTATAFGSLALSRHPGTASMGVLLSLSLAFTLATTFLILPALLGPPPERTPAG